MNLENERLNSVENPENSKKRSVGSDALDLRRFRTETNQTTVERLKISQRVKIDREANL